MKPFHLIAAVFVGNLLTAAALLGGYLAWQEYQYRQPAAVESRAKAEADWHARSNALVMQIESSREAIARTEAMIAEADAAQARRQAERKERDRRQLEENARAIREAHNK